jgi:YVTN family beta-propeller protein
MRIQFLSIPLVALLFLAGCSSGSSIRLPGRISAEKILLPNGWMLSPAGSSVPLGDLPLGMDVTPDRRFAAVINSGFAGHSISLVNLAARTVCQTIVVKNSWNGIHFAPDGASLYVSAGNENAIYRYRLDHDSLSAGLPIVLGKPHPAEKISPTGIDISGDGRFLYAGTKGNNALYKIDLVTNTVAAVLPLSHEVYTCRVDQKNNVVYATLWGGARVAVIDADSLHLRAEIPVGDHPSEMLVSDDGTALYIVNSNHNTVSVIDCRTRTVIRTISVSLSPGDPNGSTPNSLALSGDAKSLFVANADNNSLAVIDVKTGTARGFIPTGWYPTVVRSVGSTLLVTNGKGEISRANADHRHIGGLLPGTLSFIPEPQEVELGVYSTQVFENSPLLHPTRWSDDAPIPHANTERSPIKHVFYIIKENRTYDQVFGDITQGNGDSSLCMFGRTVTPNHHALAEEFVLLDNFYADAEVSADGHNWSMAAFATDYVEKTWPAYYGGGGGRYDFEEEGIATPSAGYIWDNCIRRGVTLRNYGEFLFEDSSADHGRYVPSAQGLRGRSSAEFPGWDLKFPDRARASIWMKDFEACDKGDSLPQFSLIRLPNDHTAGTRKGGLSPRAMVADNDLALGMVVEKISHSRYWKESAIFVIEDDAQNGADHVDAHRTVALVISPYTKRNFVDHTMYSTSGMLRTMELILGLPPMSQYDARAVSMDASFSTTPSMAPYTLRPNSYDIDEHNALGAYGQERMALMNLEREDAVPEREFNTILWKSVMGVHSELPLPVQNVFVRQGAIDDDD